MLYSDFVPDGIMIDPEFFTPDSIEPDLCCRLLSLFRDSDGSFCAAFDVPDMAGTYVINLGSRFFKGFYRE